MAFLLSDNKQYLVASRLGKLLEREGFTKLEQLVEALKRFGSAKLKEEVINAMTTNETLWFRDAHPFNILKDRILPEKGKVSVENLVGGGINRPKKLILSVWLLMSLKLLILVC